MTVVGRSSSFHYMSVFNTSGLKEGHISVCEHGQDLFVLMLVYTSMCAFQHVYHNCFSHFSKVKKCQCIKKVGVH